MAQAMSYSKREFPALKLVQSSRRAQQLAKILLVLMVLTICAMALAPWQQSARGTGKVIAFVPQERQQTVTSPVKGVVATVGEGIVEGVRVEQDDIILEIEPNAANLVEQLRGQVQDLQTKIDTARNKADAFSQNVKALEEARDFGVEAVDLLIEAAEAEYRAKQRLVPGYEAKELQARQFYERQKPLEAKGFIAPQDLEKYLKDWGVAKSALASVQSDVSAAGDKWEAKKKEREQKLRELQTKVDYARAMEQGELGNAATANKEKRQLEIKLAELDRLTIKAPRSGTIFRMPIYERGQAVKESDELFTIVPDTTERAVELWISGNDTPLVRIGDHVRLQFEGWPAVQFAGWPSIAVGTFGGEVVAIDATDDGTGKFRVLVKADGDEVREWPDTRFLRQGVRSNGWIMLNKVTLGYEIWRQLNGFPPVISKDVPKEKSKGEKKKVPLPK